MDMYVKITLADERYCDDCPMRRGGDYCHRQLGGHVSLGQERRANVSKYAPLRSCVSWIRPQWCVDASADVLKELTNGG